MSDLLTWLPLLNLLLIPTFGEYLKTRDRLTKLEVHKERVEIHLGFNK